MPAFGLPDCARVLCDPAGPEGPAMSPNMDIELAYGKACLTLSLPSAIKVDRFKAAQAEREVDLDGFAGALRSSGRDSLLSGRVLFVINDGYRSTPTLKVLRWLNRLDNQLLNRADFLIATGTHDSPTREHLDKIFGEFYSRVTERVNWHNATDRDSMEPVGRDQFDAEVRLNKSLLKDRAVCIIGSVEPHYFAGFTGGRKSILPGLTDLATIERNHNLANSLEARPLRLEGNPVAEHLARMMTLVDTSRMLAVQLVIDAGGKIAGAFVGGIEEAFAAAVDMAHSIYAYQVEEPYNAVVCEMLAPLDSNLYQAQKGLENCQTAVADGGSAIVLSACESGVGSAHFYELAGDWDRQANRSNDGVVRFGSHKLSRVNAMGRRIDVCLHSNLEEETVQRVFYQPIGDISAYICDKAKDTEGYRVAVVHDAGHTVMTRQSYS